jgi:predicted ATP-dependent endonuclease of OLD family
LPYWPTCLDDFLEKRLSANFTVKVYLLDPSKCISPDDGLARPQVLPKDSLPIEKDPLKKLIRINEIVAHRGFSDSGEKSGTSAKEDENGGFAATKQKRRLSEQLRSYYHRHLESSKSPTTSDIEALSAIQLAERNFNDRLESGFASSIKELEKLGYPGVTDPKLRITTKLHPTDGLRHSSAVQYEIASSSGSGVTPLHLPEDFAGLGYQNLIAMVFMLISFRDSWMRVGKAKILDTGAERDEYDGIPLLHLVLVEEPEAHLHAQVQQVFIKQAYDVLRFNEHLGESTTHTTQLVVSTHSSHVAHEADFSCLRYFRRRPALAPVNVPTTTVSDLSDVFGEEDETRRFVSRYLKAIHCDLFFADAVVLVEGQAERILVPHFIRHHFTRLSRRYVTLLEIGGSHAARFRPLIERLGLTTLIIGDLDSVALSEKKGINRWRSVKPERGRSQKSVNTVLTSWHPAMDPIDDLLGIGPEGHERSIHPDFSVYVAYQKALKLAGQNGAPDTEVIPRTFEDALIFDNQTAISAMTGYGTTTEKIRAAVLEHINEPEELADELFEILKSAEKAEFSLELLVQEDPKAIVPPTYVRLGLEWLDKELERRRQEIVKEAQDAAAAVQEAAAS